MEGDRPGLGVVGMQERVRLTGGRFQLLSRVGHGTRIDVWVPTSKATS
jgi:signal transduction histidine kinase